MGVRLPVCLYPRTGPPMGFDARRCLLRRWAGIHLHDPARRLDRAQVARPWVGHAGRIPAHPSGVARPALPSAGVRNQDLLPVALWAGIQPAAPLGVGPPA